MKRNEMGDFTVLYVEPGDQRADLFQTAATQKKPMIIVLANQAGVLQKPDDFTLLKYVKRQADLPIIFILPLGSQQAQLAARNGFPVYQSMDALLDSLSIGQITRIRTNHLPSPSRSADTSSTIKAPASPRSTRPLFPDEVNQGVEQGSRGISHPFTPVPQSCIPAENAEQQKTYPDPHRTLPLDPKDNRQYSTGDSWSGTDIHVTDRHTAPLAPNKPVGVGLAPTLGAGSTSALGTGFTPTLSPASQSFSIPRASGRGHVGAGLTPSLSLFNESVVTQSPSPLPLPIELPEPDAEEEQERGQHLPPPSTPKIPIRAGLASTHPVTPIGGGLAPAHHTSAPRNKKILLGRTWQVYPRLSILICILVIVIFGSFLILPHFVSGAASTPQINGHLVFTSSGQVSETSNQGIEDQVTLDLTNLSAPTNGKALYAWLLGDKRENDPKTILLGKLVGAGLDPAHNGTAHLFYSGDAQHTSMLLTMSRVLVTEEDAPFPPIAPSPNQSAWRYFSEFSSTPIDALDNTKHFSFLDHLRHLLAADPTLEELELPGGLNKWLYNNTNKVMEWINSTRQQWEETKDTEFVRHQLQRALQFLDGDTFAYQDIPQGNSLLVNERLARVGLISVTGPNQEPPDYLDHISHHLNGLLKAKPTPAIRQKITALTTALGNVNQWLQQVRYDAQQLMKMTDIQMKQQSALSVIDDMIANMDHAYSGQPDPSTNTVHEGINWIHNQMQFLATLDITPWDSTSLSSISTKKAPVSDNFNPSQTRALI